MIRKVHRPLRIYIYMLVLTEGKLWRKLKTNNFLSKHFIFSLQSGIAIISNFFLVANDIFF
jgi:hypothetical protein